MTIPAARRLWASARTALPVLAALALTACGGQGGGATATETTQDAPSPAPYSRFVYVDGSAATATDNGTGTAAAPFKTLGGAMSKLQPGDDVVVAPGVYRESVVVPALNWGTAPTRIRAQTARTVSIKGSTEVTGWTATSNGVYWVSWPGEEPQQVWRAGVALTQVGGNVFGGYPTNPPPDLEQAAATDGNLWPGRVAGSVATLPLDAFTYEASSKRLYVRLSTPLVALQALEVSTRRHVLQAENANGLTVEGLDFSHANTSATYRQGAVKMVGDRNLLKNLVVSDMDATCVQIIGIDSSLIESTLQRCGQLAVLGRGTRLTFSDNRISSGNTRGFNKWWEAGGMKLVGLGGLHDSVLRNNVVINNDGDGIWIDFKNTNNLIENNTVAYNSGFGIHYEASQTATIRGNQAYGNGLRGIYLLESANCLIEGNSVFGNTLEGIAVVDGHRSAIDASLSPVNNRVIGNTVAWNDFNVNWVQLVLPGKGMNALSDRNAFTADVLAPRMSVGFVSPTNPAFPALQAWRNATQWDAASTTQTGGMPSGLKTALTARRLLSSTELGTYVAGPGVR